MNRPTCNRLSYHDDDVSITVKWTLEEDENKHYVLGCEIANLIERMTLPRLELVLATVIMALKDNIISEEKSNYYPELSEYTEKLCEAAKDIDEFWSRYDKSPEVTADDLTSATARVLWKHRKATCIECDNGWFLVYKDREDERCNRPLGMGMTEDEAWENAARALRE